MNMFKSRRKAREQSDALDTLNGGPPQASQKALKTLKRRNKDTPEDFKLAFDLSTALPDSNEFRTSLLMPNLSARFSMLREQDDPNTKVGKASDDSVLFPKRVSRMNLFTHTPLSDVAEVEPVYSFRPPFADRDRSNSMGDGYESDGGSIMSRSRPVEGAALYGNRQKPFKMPPTLARSVTENDSFPNNRYKHEAEVPLPQFQQFRMREKETQAFQPVNRISVPVTDPSDGSEIASPATVFSKKRGTQSSTNSGPRRSSTAATSIASESPVLGIRSADGVSPTPTDGTIYTPESDFVSAPTKPRYEAIPNRFASVSKKERSRPVPLFASTSYRNATSPTALSNAQPLDFGFSTESRSSSSTGRHQTDSPSSSTVMESDDMLASNVQPNDRGKATALGLFNKPAREFDEQKFNQRQLQMHEEYLNGSRSTSRASAELQKLQQNSFPIVTDENIIHDDRRSIPQAPPTPSTSASPVQASNHASTASGRDILQRPRSKSAASSIATSNVKARLESLIRKQNAELAALEAEKLGEQEFLENKENHVGTFLDDDDDDEESEANNINASHDSRAVSLKVGDESHIHPAFRNSYRVSETQSRKSNYSNFSRTRSVFDDERNDGFRLHVSSKEPQSIAQDNNLGLSGMIRTHLRHDSDKSITMLRPESSTTPHTNEPSRNGSTTSIAVVTADSTRSDSFNFNINQAEIRIPQAPPTPTAAMSEVAQRFLQQAMAMKDAADQQPSEEMPAADTASSEKPWQELEPKHQRGGSSETTKERREFDEELADRRRKIREGLKSVVERDRSQSPVSASRGQSVAMQAFVQQRSVTDPQPKALKMLGLQSRHGQPSPIEDDRSKTVSSKNDYRGRTPEPGFQINKHTINYARFGPDTNTERQYPPRSVTPPASKYGMRDRSNSNNDYRSNSSNDYRSESRSRQRQPVHPDFARRGITTTEHQPSSSPTEEVDAQPNLTDRNVYRGPKSLPFEIPTGMSARASPRPSPITPHSSYDSPIEPSKPSPGLHSNGRTTPSNGRGTPTNAYGRKRSVTKTMISEPKFVSSTSSVPLVHLPTAQQNPSTHTPPIPIMNPRRRGNTATGEKPILSPIGAGFSRSTPLEPVPASPLISDFDVILDAQGRQSISPRKLRKATSEGGSMAARARQQAMAVDLAKEKSRSPALPVFPNRSANALDTRGDGTMF